jgi:hypothetical protein
MISLDWVPEQSVTVRTVEPLGLDWADKPTRRELSLDRNSN